jgi:hypothetical protein
MKTARQADDPGQSCQLDNIPRDLLSSGAQSQYIIEVAATFSAAAMQIRWRGESL